MIITRDFLSFIEKVTEECEMVLLIMRTVGPDLCEDFDKLNTIYSAYKNNFDVEDLNIFNTFLKNHWTFLEFETEEEARDFARDNLPVSKDKTDPDYFIQYYIFNRGALSASNDDLSCLSHRLGKNTKTV